MPRPRNIRAKNPLAGAVLVLVLLAVSGCGARHEYRADYIVVHRTGWDSLRVGVSFVRSTVIGGDEPVAADTVRVSVFDARYRTIYFGPPGRIAVPDRQLSDRARLTVEACGTLQSRQICVQELVQASPKRLQMDGEIVFPSGGDLAAGRYDFTFQAERQIFGEEAWEPVDAEGVEGYMRAWVEDPEARTRGVVRFPFEGDRGRFDLSRHGNYKNFRYYLDSELLDEERAEVAFEVHAGLGGSPMRVATLRTEVLQKTDDERVDEVRYFVEQATERLIDELGSFLGGRRAVALVQDWAYNRLSRTYRITMEAEWEGSFFNRGDVELEGVLEVREDGSDAVFELRSGNRRGVRRWQERTDGDELRLGALDVLRDDSSPVF